MSALSAISITAVLVGLTWLLWLKNERLHTRLALVLTYCAGIVAAGVGGWWSLLAIALYWAACWAVDR